MSLESDILAVLTNLPASVQAKLPADKVWFEVADDSPGEQYAVCNLIHADPQSTMDEGEDGSDELVNAQVQVTIYQPTHDDVVWLAKKIKKAMVRATTFKATCREDVPDPLDDTSLFGRMITFSVWHREVYEADR